MTAAEIRTELDALDTAEAAARSAFDFDLSTGTGGGKVSVRGVADKLRYLQQRRLYLQRRLFVIEGNQAADQVRNGIDDDKSIDNGDSC